MVQSTEMPTSPIDLAAREARLDPYSIYSQLRSGNAACYDRQRHLWVVSRYDIAKSILEDPETFSSERASFETTLAGADGERHRAVRRLIAHGLIGRHARWLEQTAATVVERTVREKQGSLKIDLTKMSRQIAVEVSALLVGLDASHVEALQVWSRANLEQGEPFPSEEDRQRNGMLAEQFKNFMADHVRMLETVKADYYLPQVLGGHGDAQSLSFNERLDIAMLLIVAGTETTTSLLTHALRWLLDAPELVARLTREPEAISAFIEEVLRYETPVQRIVRVVTRTTRVGDIELGEGSVIELLLGSANRDGLAIENPDVFQIRKANKSHLAFGYGVHLCLGAALARIEAATIIRAMLREIDSWIIDEAAKQDEVWKSFVVNTPKPLHVSCPFRSQVG